MPMSEVPMAYSGGGDERPIKSVNESFKFQQGAIKNKILKQKQARK